MADTWLTVGNKLGLVRRHFGLSQAGFADVLSRISVADGGDPISRSTIAAYETRTNANPSDARARAWARYFGIPFEWFLDGKASAPPVPHDHLEAIGRVDVVSRRNLGDSKETIQASSHVQPQKTSLSPDLIPAVFPPKDLIDVPFYYRGGPEIEECHFKELPMAARILMPKFFFSGVDSNNFFVFVPVGRSMAPRISDRDHVIARNSDKAPPESIVVVRRSDGVDLVKVLRYESGGKRLFHSVDPDFDPVEETDDLKIRAVVIGVHRPFVDAGLNLEFFGGAPLRGQAFTYG